MIPSIASRLDVLADIADQMEHPEENTRQLLFKYLLQSIQKQQQQNKPIDVSTKLTAQYEHISHPLAIYSKSTNLPSSNVDLLKDSISNSSSPSSSLDINQTDVYSERRKKNNEAAKRSRDARRVKEDEIAMKATWLEQENLQLRLENAYLKQENTQLRSQFSDSIDS
ncbi:hypothetical protein I4U23_020453 [Adineta vaga]|nr:hypothetical protein I4U23_020453 [Adineta vaga]